MSVASMVRGWDGGGRGAEKGPTLKVFGFGMGGHPAEEC